MDASTLAAWWGSITGTIALGWEIYQSLNSGPKLKVRANPNFLIVGAGRINDHTLHVNFHVANVGDAATTLTHLCVYAYKGWWSNALKRKPRRFVLTTGPEYPIPKLLNPGETWTAMFPQQNVLNDLKDSKFVYGGVMHSMAEKPVLVRIVFSDAKS